MVVAFVSGHRDITQIEFDTHYVPLLNKAISEGHRIVVGDYQGVDFLAQRYLREKGYGDVIVYHMFTKPRYYVDGFVTRGGYISDEDRDSAMTNDSHYDIAFVRAGKEGSGTDQNIKRRANALKCKSFDDIFHSFSPMFNLFNTTY